MMRSYSVIGFIVFWGIILGIILFLAFWGILTIESKQEEKFYEEELNGRHYDGKGKV